MGACFGAGDGTRTRDIDLGKVALYQLSYSRPAILSLGAETATSVNRPSPAPVRCIHLLSSTTLCEPLAFKRCLHVFERVSPRSLCAARPPETSCYS